MQITMCGKVHDTTRAALLNLMISAARLDVARNLKRLRGIPGEQAARTRTQLEEELQHLDELAHEARAGRAR